MSPGVPGRKPFSTSAQKGPMTGMKFTSIHHADLSRSCHRLACMARLGQSIHSMNINCGLLTWSMSGETSVNRPSSIQPDRIIRLKIQ